MAGLVSPTSTVRDSYIAGELAMCAEEGVSTDLVTDAQQNFEEFVQRRSAVRTHWGVPVTELWYVDRSEYIGTVIVRHRLTPELEIEGGHIGFHVVPAYRRQGHATQMLTEARRFAKRLGLKTLLLTCEVSNIGSRRAIERNGGVLLDANGGIARYEVAT
jgi:predicted acetyltransferase